MRGNAYAMIDRILYLLKSKRFSTKEYMAKWEVSKHTLFRDLEYLSLFQRVDFKYNRNTKQYERVENDR